MGDAMIYASIRPEHWAVENIGYQNLSLQRYFYTLLEKFDHRETQINLSVLEDHIQRGAFVLMRNLTFQKYKYKKKLNKVREIYENILGESIFEGFILGRIIDVMRNYLKRRTMSDQNTKFVFDFLNREKQNFSLFSLDSVVTRCSPRE